MEKKKIIADVSFYEGEIFIISTSVFDLDETSLWKFYADSGYIRTAKTRMQVDGFRNSILVIE